MPQWRSRKSPHRVQPDTGVERGAGEFQHHCTRLFGQFCGQRSQPGLPDARLTHEHQSRCRRVGGLCLRPGPFRHGRALARGLPTAGSWCALPVRAAHPIRGGEGSTPLHPSPRQAEEPAIRSCCAPRALRCPRRQPTRAGPGQNARRQVGSKPEHVVLRRVEIDMPAVHAHPHGDLDSPLRCDISSIR